MTADAATITEPRQRRIDEVIEEVEFIGHSDGPESIAKRLGYSSPKNLARVLHRAGRADLANRFDTASANPLNGVKEPTVTDPTADLLAKARKSDKARTRNLAVKIEGLLVDLSDRLDAEREAVKVAQEIAALQAKIDALRGSRDGRVLPPDAPQCDDCGRSFVNAAGLARHRTVKHGGVR